MAFTATYMEIIVRYLLQGQQCQTGLAHRWDGLVIAAATADQVAEAYWNEVKDEWRAVAVDDIAQVRFQTVVVREIGGSLSLGEYAIPAGEQNGTRPADVGNMLPSYVAVGCRLTVGSRVTRPGQKRIPFLCEDDNSENNVDPAFLALCEPLAECWSSPRILGAPVATGVVTPAIVSYGVDNDTVDAAQDVIGYVLNPNTTSQVSRRYGHGS